MGNDTAGDRRPGRNYVVVSADTHASPDSLEDFLSYVDPVHREAVAAFGDLSSLAISMFGGFDPGEVDESDPVRATAARRLAGMGVDIDAAAGLAGPLRHGLGGARRRRRPPPAVLEDQGIHAEVDLARSRAGRRPLAGHVPGRSHRQRTRGGVAGAARLHALAGRVLRCGARSARRLHAHRLPRHGPGRRRGGLGPGARHLRRRHVAGHVGHLRAPRLCRRLLRALLERLRGARHGGQPPHRRLGFGHRHQVPLRRRCTAGCWASSRSSSSPVGRCGS